MYTSPPSTSTSDSPIDEEIRSSDFVDDLGFDEVPEEDTAMILFEDHSYTSFSEEPAQSTVSGQRQREFVVGRPPSSESSRKRGHSTNGTEPEKNSVSHKKIDSSKSVKTAKTMLVTAVAPLESPHLPSGICSPFGWGACYDLVDEYIEEPAEYNDEVCEEIMKQSLRAVSRHETRLCNRRSWAQRLRNHKMLLKNLVNAAKRFKEARDEMTSRAEALGRDNVLLNLQILKLRRIEDELSCSLKKKQTENLKLSKKIAEMNKNIQRQEIEFSTRENVLQVKMTRMESKLAAAQTVAGAVSTIHRRAPLRVSKKLYSDVGPVVRRNVRALLYRYMSVLLGCDALDEKEMIRQFNAFLSDHHQVGFCGFLYKKCLK